MTYYRIAPNPKNYLSFSLSQRKLLSHFRGKAPSKTLLGFCQRNERLAEFWSGVNAEYISIDGMTVKDAPIPDITIWKQTTLAISPKARDAIGETLLEFGELLPINIKGLEYSIFNCTNCVDADEDRSSRVVEHDTVIDVESVVFNPKDIEGKVIFKTFFDGCRSLFCTESFKSMIEKHQLTGGVFKEDLADIFD